MKKVKLGLASAGLIYNIEAKDIYKEENIKKIPKSEFSKGIKNVLSTTLSEDPEAYQKTK